LNRYQYSALAEKFMHSLMRLRLERGDRIQLGFREEVALSRELGVHDQRSHEAYRVSLEKYGPYNEAAIILLVGESPSADQPCATLRHSQHSTANSKLTASVFACAWSLPDARRRRQV
jgi:hypothetical protein